MWLWPLIAVMAAVPPKPSSALPESIRTTLNQEYPGWKFAHHAPALVSGDFNHDGKQDYAVQITLNEPGQEEQIIMFFLAREASYEETIVQSMGLDPAVYLQLSHQSNHRDVLRVLGGPAGDTAYGYENDKFQEMTPPEEL